MFFQQKIFAVVGASNEREKFGNRVLCSYIKHGFDVHPINKKSNSIEGLVCYPSLTSWLQHFQSQVTASELGVSIVTPPGVTQLILQEGYQLGIRHFFLQPGTYDKITEELIRNELVDASIVKGCVMVELGW